MLTALSQLCDLTDVHCKDGTDCLCSASFYNLQFLDCIYTHKRTAIIYLPVKLRHEITRNIYEKFFYMNIIPLATHRHTYTGSCLHIKLSNYLIHKLCISLCIIRCSISICVCVGVCEHVFTVWTQTIHTLICEHKQG